METAATTNGRGALAGVRAVEVGGMVSSAIAARLLGDLGAEVIKVEEPGGDPSRRNGPFPGDHPDPEASGQFIHLNVNKLGVTLDAASPAGRRLLRMLLAEADVAVWGASQGGLEGLPVRYAEMREVNPRLVLAVLTPYGATGPYARLKGTDLLAFQASGTGHRYLGWPDREPLRAGASFGELWTGASGAAAAMLAMTARRHTGRGQVVDLSEAENLAITGLGYQLVTRYFEEGLTNARGGPQLRASTPAGVFTCLDGFIDIQASERHQWEGLKRVMGNPEWAQSPIFNGTSEERSQYRTEINGMVTAWTMTKTKAEIFSVLQAAGVPAVPVSTVPELFHSGHLRGRGFFARAPVPGFGEAEMPGRPFIMSRTPWAVRRPAPTLGQHNAEVFCGRLGLAIDDLADLRRAGVI